MANVCRSLIGQFSSKHISDPGSFQGVCYGHICFQSEECVVLSHVESFQTQRVSLISRLGTLA